MAGCVVQVAENTPNFSVLISSHFYVYRTKDFEGSLA